MSEKPGGGVKERERSDTKEKEPALYHVVLLNDDYTPMMFVVDVLEDVFQKPPAEAYRIMMQVHVERPRCCRQLSMGNRRNESRQGGRRLRAAPAFR